VWSNLLKGGTLARRKATEVEYDPETMKAPTIDLNVLEVRGRDDHWNVFYPQAENIATPIPVYDQEGRLKGKVDSWVATNKFSECHETFTTAEEAAIYADQIHPGCEVKIITFAKRGDNLKKNREEEDGTASADSDET
jgi:hypothetical protein